MDEAKLTHLAGERCPDFDEGCFTCVTWQMFDQITQMQNQIEKMTEDNERLRQHLACYADLFCELGQNHECCGKMDGYDCSGCRARIAIMENRP